MKALSVSDIACKTARSQRATLRKRRRTLFKKADEFHKLCRAEVYLVLYKQNRFYVYSSNGGNAAWPPNLDNIASIHLLLILSN